MADKVKIHFFKVNLPVPAIMAMPDGLSKEDNFIMFIRNGEAVKISRTVEDPETEPTFKYDYLTVHSMFQTFPTPNSIEIVEEENKHPFTFLRQEIEEEIKEINAKKNR